MTNNSVLQASAAKEKDALTTMRKALEKRVVLFAPTCKSSALLAIAPAQQTARRKSSRVPKESDVSTSLLTM